MANIGDTIRIICMQGEPQYTGKVGIIKEICVDPWGDTQIWGTWGGCALYLGKDNFEVLKERD